MRRTLRRLRRAGHLLLAIAGLVALLAGCGDEELAFDEGVRVDLLDVRDIAVTVTDTRALITWLSRVAGVSQVRLSSAAGSQTATGAAGTTHRVEIEGLTANTLYTFEVSGHGRRYRFRTLGGPRSRIAFVSDRTDFRREVYLCLDWGENVTRVTDGGGHSPAISSDGTQLAWAAPGEGGLDDIFACALDADGVVPGTTVNLTATAERAEAHPAFSPDGTRLAFVAAGADQLARLVIRLLADGSETEPLADGSAIDEPAWSPDGTMLAFVGTTRTALVQVRNRPIDADSVTVTRDDAARTPLEASEFRVQSATDGVIDFSRGTVAGESVLISYTFGGTAVVDERQGVPRTRRQLFTIGADGAGLRRLTEDRDARGAPAYHPDGRILHTRESSGETSIRSISGTGSGERELIGGGDRSRDPSVAPDGSSFVFSSNRERERLTNLFRGQFDGEAFELSFSSSGDTEPAWGPIP